MLVKNTKIYAYEGKSNDSDFVVSVREQGEKSLLDAIELELTGEQNFIIKRGENVLTSFSKIDYENENVDLTLKMLKSKVLEISTKQEIFKTRGTRTDSKTGKSISCFYDNVVTTNVEIIIE